MKNFALSNISAFEAYRFLRLYNYDLKFVKIKDLGLPTKEIVCDMKNANILSDRKTDVALFRNAPYKKKDFLNISYICRAWNSHFVSPKNNNASRSQNFHSNCYLPSPALLLIELARYLNPYQLLYFSLELGGCYSVSPTRNEFFVNRKQLLKHNDLLKAVKISKSIHAHGSKTINLISKIFQENAASPMESFLFSLLSFPTYLGGAGLRDLKLNYKISLSNAATKIAGQPYVIVDICHQKSQTAIEYDSRRFHSEVDQSQLDKRRRDALQFDGWKCVSVVPEQINNFEIYKILQSTIIKLSKGNCRISVKNYKKLQRICYSELKRVSTLNEITKVFKP